MAISFALLFVYVETLNHEIILKGYELYVYWETLSHKMILNGHKLMYTMKL